MSGRTIWLAQDADWHTREWLVDLGEEFGPVGPLAINWLECAAKRQNAGGKVKAGVKAVARGVYSDAVTVRNVLSRSLTLGLLIDFEETGGLFKCVISWWPADQERALGAERVARHRRRTAEGVTVSNGEKRSVTNTGQERREQGGTVVPPASGRSDLPADFPQDLQPHLEIAHRVLADLAQRQGANAVQVVSLASVIMARRNKPLVRAAHDFAAWADGKAQRRKDVVAGYRNWLDRVDDLAGIEHLDGDPTPKGSGRFAHLDAAAGL